MSYGWTVAIVLAKDVVELFLDVYLIVLANDVVEFFLDVCLIRYRFLFCGRFEPNFLQPGWLEIVLSFTLVDNWMVLN